MVVAAAAAVARLVRRQTGAAGGYRRGGDDDPLGAPVTPCEYLTFPPFGPDHLDNSLQHRSGLVASVWLP